MPDRAECLCEGRKSIVLFVVRVLNLFKGILCHGSFHIHPFARRKLPQRLPSSEPPFPYTNAETCWEGP